MGYQNFYATKLNTDIGASDTSIVLETAPSVTSGRLTLEARNPTQKEIIKYTGVSGNTITGVTRGQGGTSAKSHVKNSLVEMNATGEDLQDILDAFNSFAVTNNGWTPLVGYPVTSVTYKGNRSYECVLTGDASSLLSAAMRWRTTRTVAAPTQCTDLESSSSQYASRTSGSVAGFSFTNNFTCEAWVKIESYTGAEQVIVGRYSSTSGFAMRIGINGQVNMFAGTASTFDVVETYQAIPLNKWVHIAVAMDLATPSAAIYIDGVSVPINYTNTASTALTQAGDLTIGKRAYDATQYFDGKISEVRVWSALRTQAQVRDNLSHSLVGTETNLVGYWKLNGNFNDSTTNANNLTASGGAVATNADSPFGGQADGTISSTLDYGILQKVSFSGGNTTTIVQVAEGCTIPTTGGVTSVAYSSQKAPYGFPTQRSKWLLQTIHRNIVAVNTPVAGTWYNINSNFLTVPVGSWRTGYSTNVNASRAVGSIGIRTTLSTANNTEVDKKYTRTLSFNSIADIEGSMMADGFEDTNASTVYYLNTQTPSGGVNIMYMTGDRQDCIVYAENSYL